MGRGNREGSVGKLLTKRGPGRFTRFLFDNIRKREKERERERARAGKVTPEYHGEHPIWLGCNWMPWTARLQYGASRHQALTAVAPGLHTLGLLGAGYRSWDWEQALNTAPEGLLIFWNWVSIPTGDINLWGLVVEHWRSSFSRWFF